MDIILIKFTLFKFCPDFNNEVSHFFCSLYPNWELNQISYTKKGRIEENKLKEQNDKGINKTKCIPDLQTRKREKVSFFSRPHPNPSAINQKSESEKRSQHSNYNTIH